MLCDPSRTCFPTALWEVSQMVHLQTCSLLPPLREKMIKSSVRSRQTVSAHYIYGEKPVARLPWTFLGKCRVSLTQFVLTRSLLQIDRTEPFL